MGCEKAMNEQGRVALSQQAFSQLFLCLRKAPRVKDKRAGSIGFVRPSWLGGQSQTQMKDPSAINRQKGFLRAVSPLKYFLRVLNAFTLARAAGGNMQSVGAAGKKQDLVASAAAGVGNGQPAICNFRTEDFRDRTVFRIEPYAIDRSESISCRSGIRRRRSLSCRSGILRRRILSCRSGILRS